MLKIYNFFRFIRNIYIDTTAVIRLGLFKVSFENKTLILGFWEFEICIRLIFDLFLYSAPPQDQTKTKVKEAGHFLT